MVVLDAVVHRQLDVCVPVLGHPPAGFTNTYAAP